MSTQIKKNKSEILEYKGYPLMRADNIIYYGSMSDEYIIMMQILSSKKVGDLDVATKVALQLERTSSNIKAKDRVIKKTEKNGLYDALDIAEVWLKRALASK